MHLTSKQLEQIQNALLDGYSVKDELRMLARLKLDQNLDAIVDGGNLRVLIFNLVSWAERTDRVSDLVLGACDLNPGNAALQQLAQEWRITESAQGTSQPVTLRPPNPPVGRVSIDLFLSYSRKNLASMHVVRNCLREAELSVWTDEGLEPGTLSWRNAIEDAIGQAEALVVLLSPDAKASTWVGREVTYAQAMGKRVFTALVAGETTVQSVPINLIDVHWVDARQDLRRAIARELRPAILRYLRRPQLVLPPIEFDGVVVPVGERAASVELKDYQDELFISRPAGTGSEEDAALQVIANWVQRRMKGSEDKAILRLEAPPGFGKSWILRRFVAQYQARWRSNLLIFGPFIPPQKYDASWLNTNIDQFFCNGLYGIDIAGFRTSTRSTFQNLLVALVEDAGKLVPSRHLLFIMDNVDQAAAAEELETNLLVPLADNSARYGFSLLLAIRSDFRFRTVEQLRRPSQFERVTIPPLAHGQPYQQILALLKAKPQAHIADNDAETFVKDLFDSLQDYTWGIPALNAEILGLALQKWAAQPLTWTFSEIEICLLRALRLTEGDTERNLLRRACVLCSALPEGWRPDDVQRVLTIDEEQAAEFRNRIYALNLVEKPPDAAYGTYRFPRDWNSILAALASR